MKRELNTPSPWWIHNKAVMVWSRGTSRSAIPALALLMLMNGCIDAAPFAGDVVDAQVEVSEPDTTVEDGLAVEVSEPDTTVEDGLATDTQLPGDLSDLSFEDVDVPEPFDVDVDATEVVEPCAAPGCVCTDASECTSELCYDGTCCEPECAVDSCDDGCGGDCGGCSEGMFCHEDGTCDDQLCVPGLKYCGAVVEEEQDVLYTCNEDGSGSLANASDCQTSGESCVACPPEDSDCIEENGGAQCVCVASCGEKTCGDDGCGGVCGICADGDSCVAGICACVASCGEKACGDDGCGGVCGTCADGDSCVDGVCACVLDCQGLDCGDDGCGGSCGECDAGMECDDGDIEGEAGKCIENQTTGICGGDNKCEGDSCTNDELWENLCASGPGTNSASFLFCVPNGPGLSWKHHSCTDGEVCDWTSNTCTTGAGSSDDCAAGGDPCVGYDCFQIGETKCLSDGKAMRCEPETSGDALWNWMPNCPDGSPCEGNACAGSDPATGCLTEATAAAMICGQGPCCEGMACFSMDVEVATSAGICADTDEHTWLTCEASDDQMGYYGILVAETCPQGETCDASQGGCVSNGSGDPCAGCANNMDGQQACIEDTCVSCAELCIAGVTCGLVVGTDEKGSCDCQDNCGDGMACDHAINQCIEADCGPTACASNCGSMVNPCGEVTYCGGACGLGSCQDDAAHDVVVAANNHIYVVGHQCYTSGATDGCWVTIWHLNPDGVLIDVSTHGATEGWPENYNNSRAIAATISNDHLFVVGATEMNDLRYGFVARYDLKGATQPPGPLAMHIHDAPSVFLDVAADTNGTTWLGGGVIVVGYTEPYGPSFPSARDSWAMRYKAPSPTTLKVFSDWGLGADFFDYSSTGEDGLEDMATSVALISNKKIIISGFTAASGANGNLVDPYMVAIQNSSGNFASGITFSSLYDRRPLGMLLDAKVSGKPWHGFVVGHHTNETGEHPWLAEFTFSKSSDATQTVLFSQPTFDWVDETKTGTLFDACWRGPELVLVGNTDIEGTNHLVGTVYGLTNDPDVGYELDYSIQQGPEDIPNETQTKGRISACTDVLVGNEGDKPSLIIVGDVHQPESESGAQDALIAKMSEPDDNEIDFSCVGAQAPQ